MRCCFLLLAVLRSYSFPLVFLLSMTRLRQIAALSPVSRFLTVLYYCAGLIIVVFLQDVILIATFSNTSGADGFSKKIVISR